MHFFVQNDAHHISPFLLYFQSNNTLDANHHSSLSWDLAIVIQIMEIHHGSGDGTLQLGNLRNTAEMLLEGHSTLVDRSQVPPFFQSGLQLCSLFPASFVHSFVHLLIQ